MGILQRAYETYEAMGPKYAGTYRSTQKEAFAPVSHTVTRANIEIVIDTDGCFHSARTIDKNEPKVIIPVTEESAGRTSKAAAHPLCEQIGYVCGMEKDKLEMYVLQLQAWVESEYTHPSAAAVLKYVKRGTVLEDLEKADIIKRDEKGKIKNEKDLIKWRVLGADEPDCTKDRSLFDAFIRFYQRQKNNGGTEFCMILGKQASPAVQHPKGVVAFNGNAKIISANDSAGFTYRGRFTAPEQALTVSYEASQKAHAALRWLIANQGITRGGRTFLCWNPEGIAIPALDSPLTFEEETVYELSNYRESLKKALDGWTEQLPDTADAVIAAFDAATTGRLSVTYYNELKASDFVTRLYAWDESCCWYNGRYGVQSPLLYNIVNYAFGNRRDSNNNITIEIDDKILSQHMQRLIACRIEQTHIPLDIVRALTVRCGSLQLYNAALREKLLFTACAVVRKYHNDVFKEEWDLALEPHKKNISYQYGRLLALLEKVERDTYDRDEQREPNAIRLQPMFVQRPQSTFAVIMDQLKRAYLPRLKPGVRTYYERMISDVMSEISEFPESEWNGPLKDVYLMGYYLQKRELYQPRKNQEEE